MGERGEDAPSASVRILPVPCSTALQQFGKYRGHSPPRKRDRNRDGHSAPRQVQGTGRERQWRSRGGGGARAPRMGPEEGAAGMGAIGNHEESTGDPVGEISAALNIADKSDVHRSRVRETNPTKFDIHDRVNYATLHSFVRVAPEEKRIDLEMSIDTSIAPLMDYFEIFLHRMIFIRRAVTFLGCEFQLTINRN